MKIKKLIFNWYSTNENGEEFAQYEVGRHNVKEIIEHQAQGEGDKWYYDVILNDGTKDRIFNPNTVEFVKEDSADF